MTSKCSRIVSTSVATLALMVSVTGMASASAQAGAKAAAKPLPMCATASNSANYGVPGTDGSVTITNSCISGTQSFGIDTWGSDGPCVTVPGIFDGPNTDAGTHTWSDAEYWGASAANVYLCA